MPEIVEARSLGLLTTLASDPPLYPYNSTYESHGPLALYIVRVPGSKDVFLTPLKPRNKVVNAQDVQSSLYYLHFDEPEDASLLSGNEASDREAFSRDLERSRVERAQIFRKPLPTPPISPLNDFGGPLRESKLFPGAKIPRRKPVSLSPNPIDPGLDQPRLNPGLSPPTDTGLDLPQLPPRPSYRTQRSSESTHGLGIRSNRRPVPDRPSPGQVASQSGIYDSESVLCDRPTADMDGSPPSVDPQASLTLIRRDPSSGAQWNVAKIFDPPVEEVSSEAMTNGESHRSKRSGAPLFVDISNPGYSKFLRYETPMSTPRISTDSAFGHAEGQVDTTFRRRIWMDGSKFADHAYAHKKSLSVDASRFSRKSLQDFQVSPRALVDRRSKGYSFRSPWGGKCEFATGVAGRSLKCKYHPEDSNGPGNVDVSELRFNLPSTSGSGPLSGDSASNARHSKRASLMTRMPLHRRTHSDESWDGEMVDELPNYFDEKGNINLTLGQERAGGGFHGKSAKLGKLIIDEMGMKMLDLTVAANMALWWRAYERA